MDQIVKFNINARSLSKDLRGGNSGNNFPFLDLNLSNKDHLLKLGC